MKKKTLSLALALTLCLGLTIPVLAEESKTAITDDAGYSYTLSQPIAGSYTMERGLHSDKETGTTAKNVTVYQIQKGTVITPVCSEGTLDPNTALGSGYKLTTEEGLKQAGAVIGADRAERATYFVVVYEEVEADGSGDMHAVKNLVYEYDDNYNEVVTQPLAEGVHLIRREVRWVYAGNSDNPAAVIPPSQGEGCASYLYVEVVSKSQPTDPEPTTPPPAESATASPTNDSLTADGVLQSPTVYKINGSNYFKIRDLAAILNGTEKQFSVGYDSALKSVTAATGQGYEKQSGDLAGAPAGGEKTAAPSNDAIYIDGEKVEAEVYKIDGSNYFKLRDLGKALDFYVGWSAETGVFIETGRPYAE